MEANTKQQQLLFDKGITNVPSDNLCSDNTLAESVGMVYDNGEHRVIQEPILYISKFVWRSTDPEISGCKLLYIHKFNNETRYICAIPTTDQGVTTYDIGWGTKDGLTIRIQNYLAEGEGLADPVLKYVSSTKITSIGKTLIISDSNGFFYCLWKPGTYLNLGNKVPEPKVEFKMQADTTSTDKEDRYVHDKWDNDVNGTWNTDIIGMHGDIKDHELWNEICIGYYRKLTNKAYDKKCFTRPFMVRYAVEMYDGEYTYISNPMPVFPSIRCNGFASLAWDGSANALDFVMGYAHLYYKNLVSYEDWTDIVKGVTIFMSAPIDIFDAESDQIYEELAHDSASEQYHPNELIWDGVCQGDRGFLSVMSATDPVGEVIYKVFKFKDEGEILSNLKDTSVFYKLCDIGVSINNSFVDVGEQASPSVLKSITSQTYIEADDYFSRSKLIPEFMYAYNLRLNIAKVTRTFFNGFDRFIPYKGTSRTYQIYVHIMTDSGEKVVKKEVTTDEKQGIYFYYPDYRATKAEIYVGTTLYWTLKLEEHQSLNGAYYFGSLPTGSETETTTTAQPPAVSDIPELLANTLIQSEVNNPFIFKAEGYHQIGVGEINGMSTITQALSEGQFGSYPLLVFTSIGIWAMSVKATGLYTFIHPMSREVCNNAASITQTDGAVFFTSEKGLMVVVGSQVKCVSEQLSGKQDAWANSMYGVTEPTFPNCAMGNVTSFFRNCHIAYDYRDSLLWIFSNSYAANYCYIYSIKSGVFSKYKLPAPSLHCVNNYPDYLIQVYSTGKVYSLLERPDINYDTKAETVGSVEVSNPIRYPATMLTRPMKLENALALKSIMHLENIKLFSAYEVITDTTTNPYTKVSQKATVKLRIFASNNLESWVEIGSLRGVPWKYYRFRYDFENLIATDRFAGTVLVTQERRTDKIR